MELLTVVATLKAKPGKEEATRNALLGLVDPTRSEPGCVQYDLHESTETPGVFVFFEKWVDQDALEQHLEKPYLRALSARVDELLSEPPDIRTYSRLA
jgi:quinol monooxygenase YgiN